MAICFFPSWLGPRQLTSCTQWCGCGCIHICSCLWYMLSICVHAHKFIHLCMCVHAWMDECVCTCVYIHVWGMCVYMYIPIFMVKIICFPYLHHILSSSWRNINSSLNRKQIRFKRKERKPFSGSAVFLISARALLYMWWYLLNASN